MEEEAVSCDEAWIPTQFTEEQLNKLTALEREAGTGNQDAAIEFMRALANARNPNHADHGNKEIPEWVLLAAQKTPEERSLKVKR